MKNHKPFRIVIAEPFSPQAIAHLEEVGDVTILENPAPETMIESLGEADALLIRGKAHVTARILNAAPRLKVIGRASPTMDHIDLRATREREISVVYSPDSTAASKVEYTLGLILSLHRRIPYFDRQLRAGKFRNVRRPPVHEIGHLTVGLLGIDEVGRQLARLLELTFGCQLIYHDPLHPEKTESVGNRVSLESLLTDVDILSIHLKVTDSTRHFVNEQRLSRMKPAALIVNAACGGVIDTTALAEALQMRAIAGAALDVFEKEPLPDNHPLRKAPNCILTPHVAAATLDATTSRFNVAEDVVRVLQGQAPRYPFSLQSDR